jgi:hypothetical protein
MRIQLLPVSAVLLAAAVTAPGAVGAPAPTLTSDGGRRIVVGAGADVQIALKASQQDSRVHIGALLLPPGARLDSRDGSPALATFRWRPGRPGVFVATFSAQEIGGGLGVTRVVKIVVRSRPVAVSNPEGTSRWAFVLRPTTARRTPLAAGAVVSAVGTKTPEGTHNLVLVLQRLVTAQGATWYRVRLPILPANSTGWLPAGDLGELHAVHTHLVVDRRRFVATLFRDGRAVFRTPVGVGAPRSPTPGGDYYVRDLVVGFNDPFYGPVAFGTSARSRVLTEWPDGGFIGIHGTNQPNILPGRVSHGCVRMPNAAVLALRRLMPVGTPITIL